MNVKKKTVVLLLIGFILALLSVFLFLHKEADIAYADSGKFSGGNGSKNTPYLISTADDFCALAEINSQPTLNGYFNVYFILTSDIDLSGRNIDPIGTQLYPFKGHVDGAGFSVTNVSINSTSDYTGLFGAISSDASLKDITVSGEISGNSNVGGIVGLNQGVVTNCVNLANVGSAEDNAVINVGGICGYNENVISTCYNGGSIHGYGVNTGGITGVNADGTVSNCFNIGTVKSEYYGAGGVAGNNEATISACYNSASISAYSTAGGIVGSNANIGVIENTYNAGTILVTNNMAGGICGGNEGAIYNSYNCADITANSQYGAISGFISTSALIDSCFSSEERFNGKLTFRGNNYPNCKILRDVDLANGDTLTNDKKAAAISNGRGAGIWAKRIYDETFCYYPELAVFLNNTNSAISDYSKNSTKVSRQTTEVTLGTLSYVYNGESNEPDVYRGEELLGRDVDYSVKFTNNVNAGEGNAATAEITLINYFKGSVTKNFSVTKRQLTAKWNTEKLFYTGVAQYPTLIIETGRVGEENITFDYQYDSNIEVGEHTVKAQLDSANEVNSNYYFETMLTGYEIFGASLVLEWSTDILYYNGLAQHPEVIIKGGIKENDSVELICSGYLNNIQAASGYTVTVTCDNDNYNLNETYTYSIEKRPITVEFETEEFYYNGKAQFPTISKVNNIVADEQVDFVYKNYENNIGANNEYSIVAELSDSNLNDNYCLSETIELYEIKRQPITVAFSETNLVYNGQPQYPSVYAAGGVIDGEEVVFKISDYSSNINATTEDVYSIMVTLDSSSLINANYLLGPVTKNYGIEQAEIAVEWDKNSLPLIYNSQAQHPLAVIVSEIYDDGLTLAYGECNTVNAGKNYSIAISLENDNYKIVNELKYEIEPMPVSIRWKGENSFVYNGYSQFPEVEVTTQTYEPIEIIYGECNNIKAGNGYKIIVSCNNSNYCLINELTYSILPVTLNIIWDENTIIYNGSVQYPKACAERLIGNEQVSFVYKNFENNFDVGVDYTVRVELDDDSEINKNYIINANQDTKNYRINKKELEIVNLEAVDREYNGTTNVKLNGGELKGLISGDEVTLSINNASILGAGVGENKSVMFMPVLSGEHSYRYRLKIPELKVNIFKAKFDTSKLGFKDTTYLYDGNLKSLPLQCEIPEFIKYEITGNEQYQIGEYDVKIHFIYSEVNVEPITDMEAKLYIAASEYNVDNLTLNILSGNIEYGAELEKRDILDIDESILPKNNKYIKGFSLDFCKGGKNIEFNGTVKVTVTLDEETANLAGLKIYSLSDGKLKELKYERTDNILIFDTENLTDFYISIKVQNSALWIGLGIGGGLVVLIIIGLVVIVILKKKKRKILTEIAIAEESHSNIEVIENKSTSTIGTKNETSTEDEKEFVIDGIYCRTYQSFIASLNYKDKLRQREICSYTAEKANRCAAGKGNGKRKELYWQGKKIKYNSKEYVELLSKIDSINKSKGEKL